MFGNLRLSVVLPVAMLATSVVATFASAQSDVTPEEEALFNALGLPQIIEIMREEGIEYGEDINTDLMSSRGGDDWDRRVDRLYNFEALQEMVTTSLFAELDEAQVAPATDFFTSDLGHLIVGLEVSARRALLDDTVEQAAEYSAAIAMADQTPRFLQLKTFVVVNDLIETNVVGALNANYAFLIGLRDGGMSQAMSDDEILSDVWLQEPAIRKSTTEWVYSFLNLAYQPLSEDDLNAYITFSDSDAGRALNGAIFSAFDEMFTYVSKELGRASAVVLSGQDI